MGLLDAAQAASNAAASTVSGPVDMLAWLLRKAGVNVGEPVGGSDWMKRKGLTKDVAPGASQVVGETLGLLAPTAVATKAPQIAKGLLAAADNLAAPRTLGNQRGVMLYHGSPYDFEGLPRKQYGGTYYAENPAVSTNYATLGGDDGMVASFDFNEKAHKVFDATKPSAKRKLAQIEREYDNATDYIDKADGVYMPLPNWVQSGHLFKLGRKAQNEVMESLFAEGYDAVRFLDASPMNDSAISWVLKNPEIAKRIK